MHCAQGYTYQNGVSIQDSVQCSNDRATYQNPAQIQAWAVNAGGGSLDEIQALDSQSRAIFSSDGWPCGAPQMHGYLEHTNSRDASHAWTAPPMQRSNGSMGNSHTTAMANAYTVQSGNVREHTIPQSLGFEITSSSAGDNCTVDFDYTLDSQSYPSPVEDDIAFAPPSHGQTFLAGDMRDAIDSCPNWPASPNPQEIHTGSIDDAYSNGWNEASVELSVSSSLSSHNPDTPMSLSQDLWEDTSLGTQPPLVPGSNHIMSIMEPFSDTQRFELDLIPICPHI